MIEIKNLKKNYGENVIYDNFDLSIEQNEKLVILGESGSGKTTLFNVIAGLTDYVGEIKGVNRPISMVFQKDMLVKNLTVRENIELVNKKVDIKDVLAQVKLEGKENAFIKNLSGGQARRVAIARAICFDAELYLLDEPFINLDLALKFTLIDLIKKQKKDKTVVLITHDIKEAVAFADRILLIQNGRIVFEQKNVNLIRESVEKSLLLEKQLFDKMINI